VDTSGQNIATMTSSTPQADAILLPLVEVFWRPRSPACLDLRGLLLDHAVASIWRNVGTDADAWALVTATIVGSESLPLVRVGSVTLLQPSWAELAPLIGRDPRERPRPPTPLPYASAGACGPRVRDPRQL